MPKEARGTGLAARSPRSHVYLIPVLLLALCALGLLLVSSSLSHIIPEKYLPQLSTLSALRIQIDEAHLFSEEYFALVHENINTMTYNT